MQRKALFALAAVISLLMSSAALADPAPNEPFAWSPKHGDSLVFDVFRNGEKFGRHVVSFSRVGDALTIDTDIELKVAFGPITAFHYVQDITERWADGRLASVSGRTKNDGKWRPIDAQATDAGLKVAGAKFRGVLSGVVIPSTHWNIAEMKQPGMFSTETGAMLPMTVRDRGLETVKTSSGQIEARRFDVTSEIAASFWYDAAGRWVKCAFETKGSKVVYVLRDGLG